MKTVIVVHHKNKAYPECLEVYSSLRGFLENNPGYTEHKINYHISQKKEPYEDDQIKLTRVDFTGRK